MKPELHNKMLLAKVRQIIDPCVVDLADELSTCYYQFWKKGLSKEFYGYDKKKTVAESKTQFDTLHGMIYLIHECLLHKQNSIMPAEDKVSSVKYNDILDENGMVVDSRSNKAVRQLRNKTPHFMNMKQALKAKADTHVQSLIDEVL